MREIGAILAILGAGSFLLNMIGFEFVLISWIDSWGTAAGTGIRFAMIVLGGFLFFLGSRE
ncbi:MAG: hypothetical protein QNI99_05220 [Woeseiaceae bacterium]|nr:hypothetical protein [Woeseiaceae bacterium]